LHYGHILYNYAHWAQKIRKKPKIIFLGSSFAKVHLIPKIVVSRYALEEGDVMNFGESSAGPFAMFRTYQKNKTIFQKAHTIFIGLDPHILGEKFYPYMLYERQFLSWAQWRYFFTHHQSYMKKYHPDIKYPIIFPFFLFFKSLVFKFPSKVFFGYEPRIHKTFKCLESTNLKQNVFEPLTMFPPSNWSIMYLKQLKDCFESEGKTVYFVLSPSYSWGYGYKKECGEYDAILVEKLRIHLGKITLLGSLFGDDFGLEYHHFYDDYHLSHTGAAQFTEQILDSIPYTHPHVIQSLYSYHPLRKSVNFTNIDAYLLAVEKLSTLLQKIIKEDETLIFYGFSDFAKILFASGYIHKKNTIIDQYTGAYQDVVIKTPESILNLDFDRILITAINHETTISSMLKEVMGISKEKVFSFHDTLSTSGFDWEYFKVQSNALVQLLKYQLANTQRIVLIGESTSFLAKLIGALHAEKSVKCLIELNNLAKLDDYTKIIFCSCSDETKWKAYHDNTDYDKIVSIFL